MIRQVIEQHGLKAGDTMKNIHGEDIAKSIVLSPSTVALAVDDGYPGVEIIAERMSGIEDRMFLTTESFALLQKVTF